jgi:hypothetical protein
MAVMRTGNKVGVSMLPRSQGGRIGLHLLHVIELAALVAFFVALGFALGPGIIAFTAVMTLLAGGIGYWQARKVVRLRRTDPAAAQRLSDRQFTHFGKIYAGIAFLVMGTCIVAIIVIFVTHA